MLTYFPQAVPEIPVSNVDKAAAYYVNVLGFSADWGNGDGWIGGISQGDCRMFLTNAPFRGVDGPKSPVISSIKLLKRAGWLDVRLPASDTPRVLGTASS
jgi:hypothetical protein